jgi:hypothetical protein
LAGVADVMRRAFRGVLGRALGELIGNGGWGSPEHEAWMTADCRVCQLGDEEIVNLFSKYARHLNSGREDLPAELFGCPTPAAWAKYKDAVWAAVHRGGF